MAYSGANRNWHEEGAAVALPANRSVGIVWSIFFLVIAAYPLLTGRPLRVIPAAISVLFLVCAFAFPNVLRPFNLLVTRLTLLLNKVTSPLAMGLIYVLAVIPTGFLARIFGADLLKLKFDPSARSYWITRPEEDRSPKSLAQQF